MRRNNIIDKSDLLPFSDTVPYAPEKIVHLARIGLPPHPRVENYPADPSIAPTGMTARSTLSCRCAESGQETATSE